MGRVVEQRSAVGLEVRGRLAVGHDQQDRLVGRVLAEPAVGQEQRVVQVGARDRLRLERCEPFDVYD
ncbi:MAG TPA: hypothetical protein VES03_02980 [Motilibacterales bacterium]|nr:hypothetical protein [Motilibacterales bacterium]